METEFNLKRSSGFYRVWILNGIGEIKKIVFYSNNKVLYETNQSWLECEERNQDLTALKIQQPKRAIKKDLNRKDNFYIKEVPFSYTKERGYVIYINVELESLSFSDEVEYLKYEDENEKNFRTTIKLNGINGLIYDPYLDKNEELQYREIKTDYVVLYESSRKERKEQGIKADKIAEMFKEVNLNIPTYEIEKLLNKFNVEITPKTETKQI